MSLETLLAAIKAPRLPNAACLGRHELFDSRPADPSRSLRHLPQLLPSPASLHPMARISSAVPTTQRRRRRADGQRQGTQTTRPDQRWRTNTRP